jgi:hypothetical protein
MIRCVLAWRLGAGHAATEDEEYEEKQDWTEAANDNHLERRPTPGRRGSPRNAGRRTRSGAAGASGRLSVITTSRGTSPGQATTLSGSTRQVMVFPPALPVSVAVAEQRLPRVESSNEINDVNESSVAVPLMIPDHSGVVVVQVPSTQPPT